MVIVPTSHEYRDEEEQLVFVGELAAPALQAPGPGPCRQALPGVLVVHEGGGINDHPRWRARLLAELGYVALACDLYGNGERITDASRRNERMAELRNPPSRLRRRAQIALDALAAHPEVDPTRLAAIGYCFGGMTVLELARSGAPLKGVVSFHGLLSTQLPAQPGAIKAKVLACTGAEDPLVPPDHVAAFVEEMRASGCDWQLVTYAHAGHGFTRKDASSLGIPGIAYDERADARSWAAMKAFLEEIFAP
jgi:dienelactone hydrolase